MPDPKATACEPIRARDIMLHACGYSTRWNEDTASRETKLL